MMIVHNAGCEKKMRNQHKKLTVMTKTVKALFKFTPRF